jgi:alcohol dehydrogenase YqhD (iron-dependent ADH family)
LEYIHDLQHAIGISIVRPDLIQNHRHSSLPEHIMEYDLSL